MVIVRMDCRTGIGKQRNSEYDLKTFEAVLDIVYAENLQGDKEYIQLRSWRN